MTYEYASDYADILAEYLTGPGDGQTVGEIGDKEASARTPLPCPTEEAPDELGMVAVSRIGRMRI